MGQSLPSNSAPSLPSLTDLGLTEMIESLSEGVIIFDPDFRITYANSAARSISRLRPQDINGPTHWEIFPETLGSRLEEVYRRSMSERVPLELEPFFYEPFKLWVSVRTIPVSSGLALLYRDVTSVVEKEGELRSLESRMKSTLELANGIGFFDWDIALDRVYADARFALIYGVDPARARAGVPLAEFTRNIHPQDLDATVALMQQAMRTGEFAAPYRLQQADGTIRWVDARGTVTFNADHVAERFTGVALDITQQKLAESALIQSEKLAAVGRMASSIAHEINNPLESVTNLIYISRSYAISPEVQHYLELADQELRRVSVIANQTLRFHKQSTRPREIGATALFSTVLSLYEGRLRNSNIEVDFRDHTNRPIACFEGDVRQVLNNLVSNAIDAMPFGGRLVLSSRETTHWPTGRRGLTLTVADTGSGIPAAAMPHLMDAFFTTKGIAGTGLGLWISSEIIDRHEGRIRVRSRQGDHLHGTVFSIFLPFETASNVSPSS